MFVVQFSLKGLVEKYKEYLNNVLDTDEKEKNRIWVKQDNDQIRVFIVKEYLTEEEEKEVKEKKGATKSILNEEFFTREEFTEGFEEVKF